MWRQGLFLACGKKSSISPKAGFNNILWDFKAVGNVAITGGKLVE
jgi:hypothetical protein